MFGVAPFLLLKSPNHIRSSLAICIYILFIIIIIIIIINYYMYIISIVHNDITSYYIVYYIISCYVMLHYIISCFVLLYDILYIILFIVFYNIIYTYIYIQLPYYISIIYNITCPFLLGFIPFSAPASICPAPPPFRWPKSPRRGWARPWTP